MRWCYMGDFQGHPFHGNQWSDAQQGRGVPTGTRVGKSSAEYPPKNPNGASTSQRFSDGKGNYTPERLALHEAIVAKYLRDTLPVRYPTATILGGGPASGKSGIADTVISENTVRIDTDEIRKELPEYQEQVGVNKAIAAFTHEEASEISRKVTKAAYENKRNLVLDGTGNGSVESLIDRAAMLRAHHYRVSAKYVVLDQDVAIARMEAAARNTKSRRFGRFVPEEVVRAKYAGVARVLPRAIRAEVFDDVEVYDNGGAGPKLILRGRRGEEPEIVDRELWDAFVKGGR